MKVLVAECRTETNTFSPVSCGLQMFRDFTYVRGDEVGKRFEGSGTIIGGFIETLHENAIEPNYSIAAHAVSAGRTEAAALKEIAGFLSEDVQRVKPDCLLLCLHGAMAAEGEDDASGAILEEARRIGGPDLIISATLDLHANLTERMVRNADIIVAFHTYPHVDQRETGVRAAELGLAAARGEIDPVMSFVKLPMLVQIAGAGEASAAFGKVMERVDTVEQKRGVLSASALFVQLWMDLPDLGCASLVVTNGDVESAEQHSEDIADLMWRSRKEFTVDLVPVEDSVEQALAHESGPIVLADQADGTGSGSPGDGTAILRALLKQKPDKPCLLSVVDPDTVQCAFVTGLGQTGTFEVGGKIDHVNNSPVEVNGYVKLLSDGDFVFAGEQERGTRQQRGKTAVIVSYGIHIVVSERAAFNWDPAFYLSLGLDPANAQVVVVKSPYAFRANYAGIAKEMMLVDGPGVSSANIRSIPFHRISRPVYPFDELVEHGARPHVRRRNSD